MEQNNSEYSDKDPDEIIDKNIKDIIHFISNRISGYPINLVGAILHNLCLDMSRIYMRFCIDKFKEESFIKVKNILLKDMAELFLEFNNKKES